MRFSERAEGRWLRDCPGTRDQEEEEEKEEVRQGEREPNKGSFTNKAFASEPEIGAEPGDFSEGKGQCFPP